MTIYIIKRLLAAIATILASATILFFILRVIGDPATVVATGDVTPEQLEAIRHRLGVDKPLPAQYVEFLQNLVTGRASLSYHIEVPANKLVMDRVPATFQLAAGAMLLALLIAVPVGSLSAAYPNSLFDYTASVLTFLGFAVPGFWLGTMLILVFGVRLHLLPTSGYGTWQHMVLPMVTLAMWPMGQLTRLVRSEMLNVLREDYIRTARAKGLGQRLVLLKHALRNALLPVITLMGIIVSGLLSGAAVTESIFGWPGMGRLVLQAALNRDFPIIEASVMFIAVVFAAINLVVDLTYRFIDPRIRYE